MEHDTYSSSRVDDVLGPSVFETSDDFGILGCAIQMKGWEEIKIVT